MKKIYVQIIIFFIVGSIGFSYDEVEGLIDQELVTIEEILSQGTKLEDEKIYINKKTLSKGESFLISLGMSDSSVIKGGEEEETKKGTGVANSIGISLSNYGIISGQTLYNSSK